MNISPHLVHLRFAEGWDYEAYRLDSQNKNTLCAKPTDDLNFQIDGCRENTCVSVADFVLFSRAVKEAKLCCEQSKRT